MKSIIKLIKNLSDLSDFCDIFAKDPNLENGENIDKKIDECDNLYLQVKKDILELVKDKNNEINGLDVDTIQFENGFMIGDIKDE